MVRGTGFWSGFSSVVWIAVSSCSTPARECAAQTSAPEPPAYEAAAWPEADLLFQRDAHWVGGDGAYTIDLGADRVLWMFGDSLIDPSGEHSRKSAGMTMISNSVAIQRGYDPSSATMTFAWRKNAEEKPTAFFADGDDYRFWPGHGIRLRDRLIVFLMKVRRTNRGLGFDVADWEAVMIRNPDADPAEWELTSLDAPANDLKVIVGSASVLEVGDYVYAYSTQERRNHPVYLVRWPTAEAYEGNLRGIEWWCGASGWHALDADGAKPVVVLDDAATEFTVHPLGAGGPYLQMQAVGFGPATVQIRASVELTGPWSDRQFVYKPPEFEKQRVMIYQGKAHPYLTGAGLVATYSTNSFELANVINDDSLYFPRFIKLTKE